MSILNFRKTFFEEIMKSRLGYTPWIVVAPSHMANGLFREISGGYYNNEAQHRAINAKVNPVPYEGDNAYKKFTGFSESQQTALGFMQANSTQRQILSQSFRADKTVFTSVGTSSYTLSHAQHTTNDNHDRDFGRWLTYVLQQGSERPAFDLLYLLLMQGVTRSANIPAISDVVSLMTLPLMEKGNVDPKQRTYDYDLPKNLTYDDTGMFADPLANTIRATFDRLAENDHDSAMRNGKLDALRRMTTLACFSFYLHLINIGELGRGKLPLMLYLERDSRTLKRASQESYRLVRQSTDQFLYTTIKEKIDELNSSGAFGYWDNEADIKRHISDTINWYRAKEGSKSRIKEETKVARLKISCLNFYNSYRATTDNNEIEALAHALTDMIGMVFSETPATVARALGVKIGLLTRGGRRENKAYELHPDLLEVLVRATIPVGEEWTIRELAKKWYDQFGVLFGGLGNENQELAKWEIAPVDVNELQRNKQALAQQLELSGYAQSYADGVVSVRVER